MRQIRPGSRCAYTAHMQTTPSLPANPPRAEPAWLWARAASLLASLISFLGSPADLIRDGDTTRRERREIGAMIALIEALVRSLLFSAAIAWLVCTSEGAATLREARRNAARSALQPQSKAARTRTASAKHTSASVEPHTEKLESPAPAADDASVSSSPSDAAIAAWLAPASLRFEPCEVMHSCIVAEKPTVAPASPHRIIRRPPPNLKLARRIEVLRHIMADPRVAILALARDLATRDLGQLYVPTPRNWIDALWFSACAAIRQARRISFTRFCFFERHRNRMDTLALPPLEPG